MQLYSQVSSIPHAYPEHKTTLYINCNFKRLDAPNVQRDSNLRPESKLPVEPVYTAS